VILLFFTPYPRPAAVPRRWLEPVRRRLIRFPDDEDLFVAIL
jgi:hypothetical protein